MLTSRVAVSGRAHIEASGGDAQSPRLGGCVPDPRRWQTKQRAAFPRRGGLNGPARCGHVCVTFISERCRGSSQKALTGRQLPVATKYTQADIVGFTVHKVAVVRRTLG